MSDVSQGSSWWMASDGKWYHPDLHPDRLVTGSPVGPATVGPKSRLMSLHFAGDCLRCGRRVERQETAWYDPETRRVTCTNCLPDPAQVANNSISGLPDQAVRNHGNSVGGSSALREAMSRGDSRWQKGAVGEYLLGRYLHRNLTSSEIVLNDRRLPNGEGNLDHIVVASSGVWIIDAKNWSGRVEFRKVAGFFDERRHLYVNGEDRSAKVEALYRQVIPVASLIGDPSVDISPALVFVGEDWTGVPVTRLMASIPYRYLGVWITWPKALVKKIRRPGDLTSESVMELARYLDLRMPAR